MKQTQLLYKSFSFPNLMQVPIHYEKKMSLSVIHSHMKFKGFKNITDSGKFPMLLHSFIAQVRWLVRKSSSSKGFWPWAGREIPGCRVIWHSMVCSIQIACAMLDGSEEVEREGKRMGKSEETQDVKEALEAWISTVFQ